MAEVDTAELLSILEAERQKEVWGVIVRVGDERASEDLAQYIQELGFSVRYFHEEIAPLYRLEIITDFTFGQTRVLVAPRQSRFLRQPHHREIFFR